MLYTELTFALTSSVLLCSLTGVLAWELEVEALPSEATGGRGSLGTTPTAGVSGRNTGSGPTSVGDMATAPSGVGVSAPGVIKAGETIIFLYTCSLGTFKQIKCLNKNHTNQDPPIAGASSLQGDNGVSA